jgi:Co/Zn/Cd efflux system component
MSTGVVEVHWLFTRVDVIANIGVFASGLIVWLTGWRHVDLLVGSAIGAYVVKEAIEIVREAGEVRPVSLDGFHDGPA